MDLVRLPRSAQTSSRKSKQITTHINSKAGQEQFLETKIVGERLASDGKK